jgi:hypothetical protein
MVFNKEDLMGCIDKLYPMHGGSSVEQRVKRALAEELVNAFYDGRGRSMTVQQVCHANGSACAKRKGRRRRHLHLLFSDPGPSELGLIHTALQV